MGVARLHVETFALCKQEQCILQTLRWTIEMRATASRRCLTQLAMVRRYIHCAKGSAQAGPTVLNGCKLLTV